MTEKSTKIKFSTREPDSGLGREQSVAESESPILVGFSQSQESDRESGEANHLS